MSAPTTLLVSDPELIAKLSTLEGLVEFRGPNGQTIRMAELCMGKLPEGTVSPISESELAIARSEPVLSVSLRDFWSQVERGEWK